MAEYTRGLFAEEKWASTRDVDHREWHGSAARRTRNRSGRGSADHPQMGARLAFPTGGRRHAQPPPVGPRTAFVLSGGGNQGVSQVGMLRALLEREIVPDVVIGTSAGALNGAAIAYAPNLTGVAQLAAAWEQLRSDHVFPGGQHPPGVERRAPRNPPLRQRGPRIGHPPQHAGPLVLRPRDPAARRSPATSTPARRSCSSGARSSPRCSRAPRSRACSRSCITTAAASSTAAWSTTSRCRTRSPGPVDRVFVLNVSSGPADRVERSPLDVVMTSFGHARSQRFELELRFVPPDIEVIVLPRPPDPARAVRLLRLA